MKNLSHLNISRSVKTAAAILLTAAIILLTLAGCRKPDSGDVVQNITSVPIEPAVTLAPTDGSDNTSDSTDVPSTDVPTEAPTEEPTEKPTKAPTEEPTEEPEKVPTDEPAGEPTEAPTEAPQGDPISLTLPADAFTFDKSFAQQMVNLCNGDANSTVPEAGFKILLSKHYDKSSDDPSHTCAYVLGKGYTGTGASRKTVYIIVIRGTSGAEWYANFDVLPERNYDSPFAENFLLAAQDVFDGTKSILASDPDALLIITGHSRGAAASNLLGMLYNKVREPANTFVYTSATPRTVRNEIDKAELGIIDSNIFNTVNEGDVVTFLPPKEWGFKRLGTDRSGAISSLFTNLAKGFNSALVQIAPDIESYYTARHSLTGPGLSDDGVTAYELMQEVVKSLFTLDASSLSSGLKVPEAIAAISETSDYYPLRAQVEKLMANGGASAIMMLSQHMQQAYSMLLSSVIK